MPQPMQWVKAINSDVPRYDSAARIVLHGVHRVGAHGDLADEHVAVGHGDHAQVLLAARLAAGGELGHRARGRWTSTPGRPCSSRPRCPAPGCSRRGRRRTRGPGRRSRCRRPSRRRRSSTRSCGSGSRPRPAGSSRRGVPMAASRLFKLGHQRPAARRSPRRSPACCSIRAADQLVAQLRRPAAAAARRRT